MDTIPNRVIAVLRREHRRFDKSGKFGQPITWVAAKLAKHPMAIKRMVNELNGRWLSAVVNEHGNLDFCCGGHRSFANSQKCKSGVDGVIQVAFVPLVGFLQAEPSDASLVSDRQPSRWLPRLRAVEDSQVDPEGGMKAHFGAHLHELTTAIGDVLCVVNGTATACGVIPTSNESMTIEKRFVSCEKCLAAIGVRS